MSDATIIDQSDNVEQVEQEHLVDPPETAQGETAQGETGQKGKSGKAALLEEEGDAAADYIEGLLEIADLDYDIEVGVEGSRAMVVVEEAAAGDLDHLVGRDGAVLDALQELTRLAATRETGERSRLMLDVAGFRAARRAELVTLAESAIAEAQRTGAPVRLDPMSPFERKVVHDAVAAAGLASESEGDEPSRYVVIRTA
ncbi:MAG: R3H domain-containing nucleic acid-binding protein [Actinomycetota bacterium]|nr:R3H domain-containing nucleic acid-binding protein [Actinomycetota bacterium]